MKMDSLSKSSTSASSSNRSSSAGGGHHHHHHHHHNHNGSTRMFRESDHFANIMVEFEKDTRERAVDVPDSFIAHIKTPPKYPPPANKANGSVLAEFNANSSSTTSVSLTPPPRGHLRIQEDGNLLNTKEGPPVPVPPPQYSSPTEQQSLRMKKYSDEIAKKNLEMERREKTNEFLRQSIRNSQKMAALKEGQQQQQQQQQQQTPNKTPVSGIANSAFTHNEEQQHHRHHQQQPSSVRMTPAPDLQSVIQMVQRLEATPGVLPGDLAASLKSLVSNSEFRNALSVNQKLQCDTSANPCSVDAQDLAEECMAVLESLGPQVDEARELASILCKESVESLLFAHDKIGRIKLDVAERNSSSQTASSSIAGGLGAAPDNGDSALMDKLGQYSEQYSQPNIKVVRIEKTSEPLGATVKNEDEAVIVGRIIRGGSAESSGLLHEGDELLEINDIPMRGKNVNEVCDILAQMQGTLTMLVVPARHALMNHNGQQQQQQQQPPQTVMHVKAHIDYDPEDDPYVPCRELGTAFYKGDILHVINRKDPNWWQAKREGDDDTQLPGLIPSANFQQRREAVKQTIANDMETQNGGAQNNNYKSTGFLCAKRSARRKGKNAKRGNRGGRAGKSSLSAYLPDEELDGVESEEVIAYEEVALYYPRSDRKRPVVLIGPPNIGRHELRQRLMQDGDRFAAAVPHTSRPKRGDEIDGQDYHFIPRQKFEQDILARKFVEHGEYEKYYYGTSLEAIRSVVGAERICVLNLHPQSLRILKNSDLMPFVVFVAPPSLEKLRRWKLERSEPVNDDDLKEIIERAREMEEVYGHYFDMVIVYSDPERAYQELLREINLLEREPQWVPASWLSRSSAF